MTWLVNNASDVAGHFVWHVVLALPPMLLSLLIAVPIGWWVHRRRLARGVVTSGFSLLYAIPSLPVFIILPLILGTGLRSPINIVVALTLYGLALMVRSAVEAFRSVDAMTLDAAIAAGYDRRQHLFGVQLPLAGPALLAGLRVVAVSTVSLVTVGGVLGTPGLGLLFVDGFQRGIMAEIITGIVGTVVLAIGVDALLVGIGRVMMPWTAVRS